MIGTLPLLAIGLLLIGLLALLSRRAESVGGRELFRTLRMILRPARRVLRRDGKLSLSGFWLRGLGLRPEPRFQGTSAFVFFERKQMLCAGFPKYATKRARPCAFMSLEPADQGNFGGAARAEAGARLLFDPA